MKLLILVLSLASSVGLSQSYPLMRVLQKDFPDNMVGPFAACGLGSYIFPDYSWLSSPPASTTNVTFSTSAPTTTTMNSSDCKGPKRLVENKEEIFHFANENIEQLAQDIANGAGESLDALAELMNIPPLDRDNWKLALKKDFSIIFPSPQIATAYVLDQITVATLRAQIEGPKTTNLSWQDLVFGTY